MGILICGFASRTYAWNRVWRDELSLGKAGTRSLPNSFKTHQQLAEALYTADQSHSNVDAVLEEASNGLAILNSLPNVLSTPELYRLAGTCYLVKGDRLRSSAQGVRPRQSLDAYQKALTVLQRGAAILEAARELQVNKIRAQRSAGTTLLL